MMPERLAKTDPFQQITEVDRLGPVQIRQGRVAVPGSKAVFVKNTDYVPRKEPPSFAAGGKIAKVDRVEWLYIPDTATAAAALNAGEVDWWEQPPADLVPVLAANKDVDGRHRRPARQSSASCASTTCSRRSTIRRCARRC